MCTGRRLTEREPFSVRKLLITLLLLLLGILPGLIYGAIQLYKAQLYAKNTAWLVARWRRADSQIPFDDLFNLPGSWSQRWLPRAVMACLEPIHLSDRADENASQEGIATLQVRDSAEQPLRLGKVELQPSVSRTMGLRLSG